MLKGVFSAFFGIFKELFKGWPKFWDIMRLNIEFLRDRLVQFCPIGPKYIVSVIKIKF